MSFVNGVFNRLYSWVSDANANIDINATRMDAEDNGFATGLSNCVLKDGTQIITANLPMAGFKFTGLGAGSARADSLTVGQSQDQALIFCGLATGTANSIILSPSPAIPAYVAGQTFRFIVANPNNAATTITISGLTSPSLYVPTVTGVPVITNGGELQQGQIAEVVYDGTSFHLNSVSSGLTSGLAPINNAALTGTVTVPTVTANDSSTKAASTQFVNPSNNQGVNGYVKLPCAVIMQWGRTGSIASNTTSTITFPTPFLTSIWNVQITSTSQDTGSATTNSTAQNYTGTTFDISNRQNNASVFAWFAIGN